MACCCRRRRRRRSRLPAVTWPFLSPARRPKQQSRAVNSMKGQFFSSRRGLHSFSAGIVRSQLACSAADDESSFCRSSPAQKSSPAESSEAEADNRPAPLPSLLTGDRPTARTKLLLSRSDGRKATTIRDTHAEPESEPEKTISCGRFKATTNEQAHCCGRLMSRIRWKHSGTMQHVPIRTSQKHMATGWIDPSRAFVQWAAPRNRAAIQLARDLLARISSSGSAFVVRAGQKPIIMSDRPTGRLADWCSSSRRPQIDSCSLNGSSCFRSSSSGISRREDCKVEIRAEKRKKRKPHTSRTLRAPSFCFLVIIAILAEKWDF